MWNGKSAEACRRGHHFAKKAHDGREGFVPSTRGDARSRSFAVIGFQDAAEFGLAADTALGFRHEAFIQDSVLATHTPVWAFFEIMTKPDAESQICIRTPHISINYQETDILVL